MFVKAIMGTISIILCVLLGKKSSNIFRKKAKLYKELYLFNNKFLVETKYRKREIDKLINELNNNDLKQILYSLNNDCEININYLKTDEIEEICNYFNEITYLNSNSIKGYLENINSILYEKMIESEKNMNKFCPLYLKLGFMGGLVLFIMVI